MSICSVWAFSVSHWLFLKLFWCYSLCMSRAGNRDQVYILPRVFSSSWEAKITKIYLFRIPLPIYMFMAETPPPLHFSYVSPLCGGDMDFACDVCMYVCLDVINRIHSISSQRLVWFWRNLVQIWLVVKGHGCQKSCQIFILPHTILTNFGTWTRYAEPRSQLEVKGHRQGRHLFFCEKQPV